MSDNPSLAIIGAGAAGVELAFSARQQGWPGAIVLLNEEAELPYQRPPLSKSYLLGKSAADALAFRPAAAYAAADIALRTGVRAEAIDRERCALRLSDGSLLHYGKLALCLGGRPRPLAVDGLLDGALPPNLHYLRTKSDADAIRSALAQHARLVIIGGGYVGLEIAASARQLWSAVTVLEAQPRILARVAEPELSDFYQGVHRDRGVEIRTGVVVERIVRDDWGKACAVECKDGSRIDCDLIVVGIGMLPNERLAFEAGLTVDRGILVDAASATSDPDILAAGDCTVHDNAFYGRRIRLESVPNALDQARATAAGLCGKPIPSQGVPWFWSDQYDLKLQMAGLSDGYDRCVLRGSMASRSFVAFYLRQGKLIAAAAVNRPADFMTSKRLVAASYTLDAGALGDESVPLKSILATQARETLAAPQPALQ